MSKERHLNNYENDSWCLFLGVEILTKSNLNIIPLSGGVIYIN
jgi:hypothetical protein